MADTLLIQFAREPRPGHVKTRMLPQLSPAQACALHEELLSWITGHLLGAELGPVEIWVAGEIDHPAFRAGLAQGVSALRVQQGADVGERMYAALADGLGRFPRVLLVGSDCPELDRDYLLQAEAALEHSDVVIGPARDGGYVLIGCRRLDRRLFRDISWGSASVLEETLARVGETGLECAVLKPLTDIDRPGDLALWDAIRGREAGAAPGEGA